MVEPDISELTGISNILDDDWTRTIYSVDASHCCVKPIAVIFPSDKYEIQEICSYAYCRDIPITCRGAGTGLLGQSLSSGIIMDFTKKMNKILEIGNNYVIAQPGVVKAVLDKELAKKGKFLPPDPASSNYCTIGGMLSNNASGPHGLAYGSMINYVQNVEVVYGNGTLGYADCNEYDEKVSKMLKFISSLNVDLKSYYPNVSKNSSGYRLDAIFEKNKVNPQKIFIASEGSLAVVTSSKVSILDIPEKKCLVILRFENILDAARAVPSILEHKPVAMELLVKGSILDGWRGGDSADSNACIMLVEFYGNDNSIYDKVSNFEFAMRDRVKILESGYDQKSVDRAWNERKNSLNRAMKKGIGSRKPAGIIEDTAVHPDILYYYLIFLLKTLAKHNLDYVVYGHAGNGNLHLRPFMELGSGRSKSLMHILASEVFSYITKVRGSISGEHGDGIIRTKFVPLMYGRTMYDIFKQIKFIFDDKKIMNPGKKIL
jgi:glycolate oxidase